MMLFEWAEKIMLVLGGGFAAQFLRYLTTKKRTETQLQHSFLDHMSARLAQCEAECADCAADREDLRRMLDSQQEQISRLKSYNTPATIIADKQGRIVDWNLAATLLFHYPREEVIGKSIQLVIPQRLRSAHLEAFGARAKNNEAPIDTAPRSLRAMRRGGEEFPCTIILSSYLVDERMFYVAEIWERSLTEDQLAKGQ